VGAAIVDVDEGSVSLTASPLLTNTTARIPPAANTAAPPNAHIQYEGALLAIGVTVDDSMGVTNGGGTSSNDAPAAAPISIDTELPEVAGAS
jgi:hypothetical protein